MNLLSFDLFWKKTPHLLMKKLLFILLSQVVLFSITLMANAQCSVCTKTAQQLGDGPASGMNTGIIYLAFIPFIIAGYIGYRWWKNEKQNS